jgi:hypothetical protein
VAQTSATKERTERGAWTFVLAAFALSRLLFLGAGAIAAVGLPWALPAGDPVEPPGFLNYWAHWDGAWYSEIAVNGYSSPERTAFFPLFPMLMRAGTFIGGGPALWGVTISLVATVFALYFLYRIAEKMGGERVARAATLAFAFFPTAFFLNAVYTEALFVALAAGSYWAAYVRRDLLLAGVLGAFAALSRNSGVILLVPLVYEWLRSREEFGWRGLLKLALVPAGLLAYVGFLWGQFGDPLIFAHAQSAYWGRELTNPLETLARAWFDAGRGVPYLLDPATLFLDQAPRPALMASGAVNVAFLILVLALIGAGFPILRPGLSMFAFLAVLLHILTPSPVIPLLGLPRFVLEAFPLFFVLGYPLSRSRRFRRGAHSHVRHLAVGGLG